MELNRTQRLVIFIVLLGAVASASLISIVYWKKTTEDITYPQVRSIESTPEYWLAYRDANFTVPISTTLDQYRHLLNRLEEATGATGGDIVRETEDAQTRFRVRYASPVKAIDLIERASIEAMNYPHLQWTYGELAALAALRYAEEHGIELPTPPPSPIPTPAAIAP